MHGRRVRPMIRPKTRQTSRLPRGYTTEVRKLITSYWCVLLDRPDSLHMDAITRGPRNIRLWTAMLPGRFQSNPERVREFKGVARGHTSVRVPNEIAIPPDSAHNILRRNHMHLSGRVRASPPPQSVLTPTLRRSMKQVTPCVYTYTCSTHSVFSGVYRKLSCFI